MSNNSLPNVKFESIKSIFNCIASSNNLSRAIISANTSLSVVTVGKIVDTLLDLNILTQNKASRSSAGRRAGVVNINKSYFSLIFDLTDYNLRCSVIDLKLNQVDFIERRYDTLTSFPDNLSSFINLTKSCVNMKYNFDNCMGIGVAVPGIYDNESDCARSSRIPEIIVIPIFKFFKKHFPNNIVFVESNAISAGLSNVLNISGFEKKDIVYCNFSPSNVCGAHFVNGHLQGGRSNAACDIGRMILDIDITLEERITLCKKDSDLADTMSCAIYNIIRVLSPHSFIIEYNMPFCTDKVNEMICDILIQKYKLPKLYLPEFHNATFKINNSHYGLAISLREKWLQKCIIDDYNN